MNDNENIFSTLNHLKISNDLSGNPFSVPCDYFDELTPKILSRAKAIAKEGAPDEEITEILKNIPKTMPFEVPAGHFKGFSDRILRNVKRQQGSVVSFIGKLNKYAVAAVAAGIMLFISLWAVLNNTSGKENENEATKLVEKTMTNIATDQLTGFLNTTDSALLGFDYNSSTNTPAKTIDFDQLLKKLSDRELEKFLKETGSDEEVIFIN